MAFCPVPDPNAGLVSGLMQTVDCNVHAVSTGGYALLAQAGSPFQLALTAMLTLYVAFIGFRMLVGHAPLRFGELTVTVIKVAVVLALATSWNAYQTAVHDFLFNGPQQLAATMLQAAQPADSLFKGNPFGGLQLAYDELIRDAALFTRQAGPGAQAMQGGEAFGALALNLSAQTMLLMTLGVFLAAKIVLGLLLAVGPVFIALFLFDATRGVFEGWLRAAAACALVPLVVTLSLALQLTMLEPALLAMARLRELGQTNLGLATGVFVLTVVFAGVLAIGGVAMGVIAAGFRLDFGRAAAQPEPRSSTVSTLQEAPPAPQRAVAVANAVAAQERREGRMEAAAALAAPAAERAAAPHDRREAQTLTAPTALGQSYRRRASPRASATAARRSA